MTVAEVVALGPGLDPHNQGHATALANAGVGLSTAEKNSSPVSAVTDVFGSDWVQSHPSDWENWTTLEYDFVNSRKVMVSNGVLTLVADTSRSTWLFA